MPFTYTRTVRFQDTDAAGVVYFANVLAMCHEAYEASLAASGVNLRAFFSNSEVAFPIIHASVDFYRPLFAGDRLTIQLTPTQVARDEFEIAYQVFSGEVAGRSAAKALTKHVCIDAVSRTKKQLSEDLMQWMRQFET
ncbi:MAG: acyl-CoA thioesterase [Microcoleus sp. PH2017_10_PVI_O_A]|uniref:acyl-CoA thioesterase n=1 Tax=unclassified Microcoleus TaxID=2642155 RepID=UPI001DB7ECAB|nr:MULTISPECIES: thioesterase family protein [unclassified Microcoleus]TAE79709.1 MAG: acyl-CoA thioesterase [Oscillatoriales cyanobacterium]MCC3407975.1 acyl-CoA thioesterase [Microcoleus sp. PH2017_10_PVI_O_A]MCC3460153.1 acyl-CoA thioesterase [Microcoleus sp. PH2017_11_PCY_U_A]MCC3480117.1 acyl-CoA thioesterase [Microcoleus sp. PH2017_12_PCY_D_A]MCC3531648.1 acyl-CoA thioesterase [Microcoleus sp. PH2017_21_RUC_O_A]